jgi:hypothetical protein
MGEKFPPGWDKDRIERVLIHYDTLPEDAALAEDEAAFEATTQTVMLVPTELVPAIRELIARNASKAPPR